MKKGLKLFAFFYIGLNNTFAGSMGTIEPHHDYSGLYAGIGTGFTNIETRTTHSTTFSQNDGYFDQYSNSRYDNTAVLFTGQIGYGKMFRQKSYLGAKASIYYTPFEIITPRRNGKNLSIPSSNTLLTSNYTSKSSIDPIYNLDLVLGYEIFPHLLPFVEGGVTFANVIQSFSSNRAFTNNANGQNPNTETINYNHVLKLDNYGTSYNVGIGANYLINKNWFFSGELVYNDLGSNAKAVSITVPFNGSLTEVYSRSERNQIISLFVGVSYLLSES